jgi:acetyltransferase-like isoleucine patch superfamily enzyme
MSEIPPTRKRAPRGQFDPQGSDLSGLTGVYERVLRNSKLTVLGSTLLLLFLLVACLLGIALMPTMIIIEGAFSWSDTFTFPARLFIRGTSIILGFFAFGFTAIAVVPVANWPIRRHLKAFRGSAYSVGVLGWYIHNILIYCVRYTFLDWITPTPFNLFFYRQMGMKVGKRVEINSSNISDAGYITLEDNVMIGGSATIIAHYAVGGFLIISPVIIRKGATIGLRAVIMGGVDIGENAKVLPGSVVLPKTVIPAGETWVGVPAKKRE